MFKLLTGLSLAAGLVISLAPSDAMAQTRTVAVTAIVEHPALDAVREGLRDQLKAEGFEDGKNIKIEYLNAQGNMTTAAQIGRQFAGASPSVIVPISTPSAQTVFNATKTIPIVFAAVSDPVGAKLVPGTGPSASGTNVTGVSDPIPVAAQLTLAHEIMPNAKRVGIVYSPGETTISVQVDAARETSKKLGLTLVEAPALKSGDVQASVKSLVGRIDFLYVPADNAVTAAFDGVMVIANRARLPVFAAEDSGVTKGAIASVGFNYYQAGRRTGAMIAKVLNGRPPGQIPWEISTSTDLAVNTASAKRLGLTIPDKILKRATKTISE
jgi:putative ABC transport system substrate-binding protein